MQYLDLKQAHSVPLETLDVFDVFPIDFVADDERVLTHMYGDWKTPTPEGERARWHCTTVVSLGDEGRGVIL